LLVDAGGLAVIATFIRPVNADSRACQRLYEVHPPVSFGYEETAGTTSFVVVSAVYVLGTPETYIFAADERGEIIDWCELSGSFRGALDHEAALRGAGYEVRS
jgi:hypothetical protein